MLPGRVRFTPHPRRRWLPIAAIGIASVVCDLAVAAASDTNDRALRRDFATAVHPFLKSFCLECHGAEKQEGKLDLSGYATSAEVAKGHRTWELVLERLAAEEMPPAKAKRQPSRQQRQAVVAWIRAFRAHEVRQRAGDPGTVPARRLSNAEYDHTIRDLTGIDIRPTREFPVDPANAAGFDNSGESLTMSPALVKKYLAAARLVADHVVLKPRGFVFAPHAAVTETDRDRFCVQRIVDFHQRHEVDYADYFYAAWQFQHRTSLGRPAASLGDFAMQVDAQRKLSAKYLAIVWDALSRQDATGSLAELQGLWRKLPGDVQQAAEARRGCETMRDFASKRRKEFESRIDKLQVKGISDGSQPLVLWKNRQLAASRMSCVGDEGDSAADAARDRFCRVFPSAFAVSSRGHYADANLGAQVRLLSAGFHLMQGYFRDDQPLCDLVLDDAARAELDSLWQELNFITLAPIRQYKDHLFFERAEPPRFAGGAEFDFARPEDKDVTSEAKMNRFRDVYLAKARKAGASDRAVDAIEHFFTNMNADIRWIERTRHDAEPSHVESLVHFAQRAYRRPLTTAERDDLIAFYRTLRKTDGLSHEDAIRDSMVSVLMSPYFCFRFDLAVDGEAVRPLTDYELASRLSYFLWSSLPDNELLARAAAGDLHQPDVLVGQTRRMLRDPRVRALATEFAGNWLDIRRFDEHNGVDRDRFPAFTNELRDAMFEEPIRFFIDVARENRSVLDFLHARHTFVNPILAKYYGIDVGWDQRSAGPPNDWLRIDDARPFGRGGLLPMAVFLTKNSPGLRTSPVQRGYWVVRRLLGEHIPAPPLEVPELPKDEAQLGDLTLPQVLARHRDNKACAGCHQRFDSIGLVFEGYGPIGERRDKDLGGRPVDATATFPDGSDGSGVDGLRRYLSDKRQDEFTENLIRKLFAYALGRSLMLSDTATVDGFRAKLSADGNRFGGLVESIVTSPQFMNKRGRDDESE